MIPSIEAIESQNSTAYRNLRILQELEKKVLWLSTWMIHNAMLITVLDGHPAALSWLGAVRGHRVHSLGVEHFGQSGNIPDLYRHYGLDAESIVHACIAAWMNRR